MRMKHLLLFLFTILPVWSWDKDNAQCKIKQYEVTTNQEALCCQSMAPNKEQSAWQDFSERYRTFLNILKTSLITFVKMSTFIVWLSTKGSQQKNGKNFHNSCVLSPKMETSPLPLFHNNFSHFWNLKINVFLQLLRVCEEDWQ